MKWGVVVGRNLTKKCNFHHSITHQKEGKKLFLSISNRETKMPKLLRKGFFSSYFRKGVREVRGMMGKVIVLTLEIARFFFFCTTFRFFPGSGLFRFLIRSFCRGCGSGEGRALPGNGILWSELSKVNPEHTRKLTLIESRRKLSSCR